MSTSSKLTGELKIHLQPSEESRRRGVFNDVIYECACESDKDLAQLVAAIERVNYDHGRKDSLYSALSQASPGG